ncbi:unnamed protein product [marine sediment metagenome]|uniref:Uncharacterized protein n=1 Tax=marine sediment metagenome TaxID=412755 RepID=X0XHN0_9ZZZZ
MHVNQAGSYQQALGIDGDVCGAGDLAEASYSIVLDEHVGNSGGAAGGIDDSAICNK